MPTIGILHPGDMGSVVGACAVAAGARVLWASEGRSAGTRDRAAAARLEDAGTVAALVAASDVILSVGPPHAAHDLARDVAGRGFAGLFVDANAVAPATARAIGAAVEAGGATFAPSALEAIAIGDGAGAASALKMAYAAYTKGSSALLMAIRALAASEGVDDALLAEWRRSQSDLPKRSELVVRDNARKAWRFVGEMEEIAAAFEAAGLPNGFHEAAAVIYERLSGYKDATTPPTMADLVAPLTRPGAE